MATNTRYFAHTDSAAPVLTGQVGSAIALLKALLVGTAGVAYGTGASEKPAAGWTLAFEDAPNNVCAFRNSTAVGGTGCYLRVDDGGTLSGGAKNVFFRTFGAMTDVNTGTDPTPPPAVLTNGDYLQKSTTTNVTARPWFAVIDERTIYINMLPAVTSSGGAWDKWDGVAWFGDYDSHVPGDDFAFGQCAREGNIPLDPNNSGSGLLKPSNQDLTAARTATFNTCAWISRNYAFDPGAVRASVLAPWLGSGGSSSNNVVIGGSAAMSNPSPGGMQEYWMPTYLVGDTTIRGRLRGVYTPLCNMTAVNSGTVRVAPSGLPAGAELVVMRASTPGGINVPRAGAIGIDRGRSW